MHILIPIYYQVTDANNGVVYSKDNIDAKKFVLSPDQDELYEFCFENVPSPGKKKKNTLKKLINTYQLRKNFNVYFYISLLFSSLFPLDRC